MYPSGNATAFPVLVNSKSIMEKFDVVIIGSGIAGSVLARRLAEAGRNVLLLEKDSFSGQTTACGGLFDKAYYDRYFADEALIEQKIKKNVFIMPWGEVVFDCDQVTVKRRNFDRGLAEQAKEKGAVLRNRSKALDYQIRENGAVTIRVKELEQKTEYDVQTKIIAFADGPQSLARNNPRFNSDKHKRFWAYAYAYETAGVPFEPDSIKIYLDKELFPWGYGWIFPNKSDSNIGVGTVLAGKIGNPQIKKKLFHFIDVYKRTAELLSGSEIIDKKGGFIPMYLIDTFADDAQVVLGDAAGMVSPLFGAGIDYAMDAAEACAPVLIKALEKEDFSRAALLEYEQIIKKSFVADLKKQIMIARIIVSSLKFGRHWAIKILAVIAFGVKYSRWNKIKILFYPLLGKPDSLKSVLENMNHK